MKEFLYEFFLGFLCTFGLFLFCVLAVGIIRIIYLYIKTAIFTPTIKEEKQTPKKTKRKHKRKSNPTPNVVRSLEIDTSSVDRIYFKKSS